MYKFIFVVVAMFAASNKLELVHTTFSQDSPAERVAAAKFGQCVVDLHHDEAARAILNNMTFVEIVRDDPALLDKLCLLLLGPIESIEERSHLIRPAMADALFQADLKGDPSIDARHLTPLHYRVFAHRDQLDKALLAFRDLKKRQKIDEAAALNERVGGCIVKDDSKLADAILTSSINSQEEQSAIARIKMQHCASLILPRGFFGSKGYADFSLAEIRRVVAVNYYRFAKATGNVSQ